MEIKNRISLALYWFAFIFSSLNFLAIVVIGWEFIWTGKGIGSFALLWFVGYFVISFAAWVIAFFMSRHKKLDAAYWGSIAIPIIMFFLLPIKFYIE
jgi:hypothetical protein